LAKFVKDTPTTKKYILYQKDSQVIMMRIWTELKNVPYSDSFNNEELYTVVGLPLQKLHPDSPASPNLGKLSYKCAYRVTSRIIFKKSVPFFGSKIENSAYDKGIESFNNWTEWASIKIA